MWIEYNPNPTGRNVDDCAVRAVSKALNTDWETAYILMCSNGLAMGDMPHADAVWGSVLREKGFYRKTLPNHCPNCYTVKDFCRDNPRGTFVLATGTHAVCAIDGDWYDSGDSSREIVIYVWYKKGDDDYA